MTRKRTRESLEQQLCNHCPTCEGKGYLQSSQTIANRIFRDLPKAATYLHGATLRVQAHPDVAQILEGEAADAVMRVRERISREIVVEAVPSFHPEQYEIVSEGERVPLLAPPDEEALARFDTAPEPLPAPEEAELGDEDAKGDEVDGAEVVAEELVDEPAAAPEDEEAPHV
jgi:hypothetical protein